MFSHSDNTSYQVSIEDLASKLASNEPPVIFVGTGLSIFLSEGLATPDGWRLGIKELYRRFSRLAPDGAKRIKSALSLEDALEFISRKEPTKYESALYRLFWDSENSSRTGLGAIRAREERWKEVRKLFKAASHVITTNYDPIAREVVDDIQNPKEQWNFYNLGRIEYVPNSVAESLASRDAATKSLIYWHGGIDNWPPPEQFEKEYIRQKLNQIVLTAGDFHQAYSLGGQVPAECCSRVEAFTRIVSSKCLLLLGYSLRDPVVKYLFGQAMHRSGKERSHYIVLPGLEDPDADVYRTYVSRYHVCPLFPPSQSTGVPDQRSVQMQRFLDDLNVQHENIRKIALTKIEVEAVESE